MPQIPILFYGFGWKRVELLGWIWVCCFLMVLPHFGLENEFGWKRVGLLGWVWVCCFFNGFATLWVGNEFGWFVG